MTQSISPVSAFSYVEMPQQLPFVDIDFDTVLQEAANGLQRVGPNASLSQMMPGAAVPPEIDKKSGKSVAPTATVENVIYAMETSTYASAITSLVGNVGATIKTLLRGG